ncbi:MAG: ABC transporter substrate-binding protein [Thermoleophilia bacterium]
MRKPFLLLALVALTLGLAACGGSDGGDEDSVALADTALIPFETIETETVVTPADSGSGTDTGVDTSQVDTAAAEPTTVSNDCLKPNLKLKKKGVLTVGTGNPAFPPFFTGGTKSKAWELNDPATGKGFESAFVYAVAKQLGFAKKDVKWVAVGFTQSFAPGKKPFDIVVQQVSFNKKRAKAVDFSDPYYVVNQALVTVQGSKIANATSFADLKDARLGVAVGTTSFDYVTEVIQPDVEPRVYDDQNGAVQALKNGQVDGIVVDFPSAFYVRDVQLDKGLIVGQFPSTSEKEYFGVVAEKKNAIIGCVNQAIAALQGDGTLAALQQKWLEDRAKAPVIAEQ